MWEQGGGQKSFQQNIAQVLSQLIPTEHTQDMLPHTHIPFLCVGNPRLLLLCNRTDRAIEHTLFICDFALGRMRRNRIKLYFETGKL